MSLENDGSHSLRRIAASDLRRLQAGLDLAFAYARLASVGEASWRIS